MKVSCQGAKREKIFYSLIEQQSKKAYVVKAMSTTFIQRVLQMKRV
jgi:hypothetical protein